MSNAVEIELAKAAVQMVCNMLERDDSAVRKEAAQTLKKDVSALVDRLKAAEELSDVAASVIDTVESDETYSPFDLFMQLNEALAKYKGENNDKA